MEDRSQAKIWDYSEGHAGSLMLFNSSSDSRATEAVAFKGLSLPTWLLSPISLLSLMSVW